jgi:hypothetical protein
VSKGDDELLKFDGRHGRHFPQRADGTYAGHHPADSDACIAELERLRTEGADYLVIPETSRWWLRHYARFAEHLETQYRLRVDEDCAGLIVALSSAAVAQAAGRGV